MLFLGIFIAVIAGFFCGIGSYHLCMTLGMSFGASLVVDGLVSFLVAFALTTVALETWD